MGGGWILQIRDFIINQSEGVVDVTFSNPPLGVRFKFRFTTVPLNLNLIITKKISLLFLKNVEFSQFCNFFLNP